MLLRHYVRFVDYPLDHLNNIYFKTLSIKRKSGYIKPQNVLVVLTEKSDRLNGKMAHCTPFIGEADLYTGRVVLKKKGEKHRLEIWR